MNLKGEDSDLGGNDDRRNELQELINQLDFTDVEVEIDVGGIHMPSLEDDMPFQQPGGDDMVFELPKVIE